MVDASALLAVLQQETGAAKLTLSILSKAVISAVNLAEVHGKLIQLGVPPTEAWSAASGVVRETVPFTPEQARIAGDLVAHTRSLGLSLGDRACLALALTLGAPVYTSDRAWKNLEIGIRIHVIR